MTRKFIATILAAAISITSINVTTAQAGDKEIARIIVGATALAIIGSAIASEQRKNNTRTHYTSPHRPRDGYWNNHGNNHGHRYKQPHYKKPQYRASVPQACLLSVRGHQGWTKGYAVSCAQRSTRANLPSDCVRRNYAQGPRLYYSPQCLRSRGFNA